MRNLCLLFFICLSVFSKAQLPETAVYLFTIEHQGKKLLIESPKLISKRTGYNNQPYFTPDDNYLYYVSSKDTKNVEIMRVDLRSKKLKSKRITKTTQPEYSPKLTTDPEIISCVRVEQDDSTQHLALYTLKGKSRGVVLPSVKNIGYYEWVTQNEFISFDLPEPFSLVLHSIHNNQSVPLAQHVGRTFYYQSAKSRLLYVDKTDSLKWFIRVMDQNQFRKIKKGEVTESIILSETLSGEEDYCIMNDGSLLMGQHGILYIKKNPFRFKDSKWEKLADLKQLGIKKFYRIAISKDNTKLAVVGFEGEKP